MSYLDVSYAHPYTVVFATWRHLDGNSTVCHHVAHVSARNAIEAEWPCKADVQPGWNYLPIVVFEGRRAPSATADDKFVYHDYTAQVVTLEPSYHNARMS